MNIIMPKKKHDDDDDGVNSEQSNQNETVIVPTAHSDENHKSHDHSHDSDGSC